MQADNPRKVIIVDESKVQDEGLGEKISNAASATYESGKEFVQRIPENVETLGTKTKDVAVDVGEGIKGAAETGVDYAKEGYEWTKATGSEGVEWTKAKFNGEKA